MVKKETQLDNPLKVDPNLNVLLDLCIVPLGVGLSFSKYVALCEQTISKGNVKSTLHSNGTSIEGKWDDVMKVVKECHVKLHETGVPRLHTVIKLGTRIDKLQTMEDKIASVKEKLIK